MRYKISNLSGNFFINILFIFLLMIVEWYVITVFFTSCPSGNFVDQDQILGVGSDCPEVVLPELFVEEKKPVEIICPVVCEKFVDEPLKEDRAENEIDYINLEVPYINEAPGNVWVGSWKNACEEAVVTMIDKYYLSFKEVSVAESKESMQILFDVQKEVYGSDANSDVERTFYLVQNHSSFGANIKLNPTIEEIKKELAEGRPVMAFHHGFDLKNSNIPFRPTGSSYHTTVVKGFDDKSGKFITNDPGDIVQGPNHLYDYDIFINSLHDYNYSNSKADGEPSVLFTFKK